MMGEWISVKDRMPGENDNYIVTLDDGYIGVTWYSAEEGFDLWADAGEVTHWMPLPEPPGVSA